MSLPPLIFGPVPAYNNPPIEPQYFKPSVFFISNILFGLNTTVTMTQNHNYVIGQEVRLLIPNGFGATKLNGKLGYVITIPASNQVIIAINSIGTDPFISNSLIFTQPQIVSVGEINSGQINSNGRVSQSISIPGSFQNISPL